MGRFREALMQQRANQASFNILQARRSRNKELAEILKKAGLRVTKEGLLALEKKDNAP